MRALENLVTTTRSSSNLVAGPKLNSLLPNAIYSVSPYWKHHSLFATHRISLAF